MSNFVPLEEAAKRLGVSAEELVEMRSRGDIFGYRDGGSWKFKPEEIERVRSEIMGDALDEDPAGSSILVSEHDVGAAGSKAGSTIGSDIQLASDDNDVTLVPDPGSGSDVKLVGRKPTSDVNLQDDELTLAEGSHVIGGGSDIKPGSSNRLVGSDIKLSKDDDDDDELTLESDDVVPSSGSGSGLGSGIKGSGSSSGSDVEIGSDISLSLGEGSDVLAGLSPVSKPSRGSGSSGRDLAMSDEDDLVLGPGSDLALGNDSGINLMSPSDSGISLEDEPLDLQGSGISGLDLAAEGSDAGGSSVVSAGASGAGSGIEINQAEEFQLTPSGAIEAEDDSGSQVIELEDSSEFGDAAVALPADDGGFGDAGGFGDGGFGDTMAGTAAGAAPAMVGTPEVPFQTGMVLLLLGILMIMGMSGILVSDMVRNMWQYAEGTSDLSSGFTKAVAGILGK